jgi:hypothetical protein
VRGLLDTANVVPSSPILVTLLMEALSSSETSVLTRATQLKSRNTPFFIFIAVKTSNLKDFHFFTMPTLALGAKQLILWVQESFSPVLN